MGEEEEDEVLLASRNIPSGSKRTMKRSMVVRAPMFTKTQGPPKLG